MKRIGIMIGSETCPPEDEMKDLRKYYRKNKKHFDESLKFLGLEGVESLSYDVQIFSWLWKNAPKNVEIVPLWKLNFTKKDLDSLDFVFALYECTYSFLDYGPSGINKLFSLLKNTKTEVQPTHDLQKFVMEKNRYMKYFKKNGFPILDTIYFNIETYKKNKSSGKKVYEQAIKKFPGPIFCKPELGAFTVGSKLFHKPNYKQFQTYLDKLVKSNYKKLLIQEYIPEFLKYHEIKTIWINGKFQYAYGVKATSDSDDKYVTQSKLDQSLLKKLNKSGQDVIKCLKKDFGLPFLLRIDWGCCLPNDNVCRDFFLNEIECCPAMVADDCEGPDPFDKLSKEIIKMV
jgi:hypothetical protein